MSEQIYEHHLHLKNDKICPFKIGVVSNRWGDTQANWHKNIEVFLCTEGTTFIQCGADDFKMELDDIVVVNSGTLHRPHSSENATYYYLIIDESFCRENGVSIENCVFEKNFNSAETKNLVIAVAEEFDKYKNKEDFSGLKVRCAVTKLLINLCTEHLISSNVLNEKQQTSEKYVKTVLEYLDAHFDEKISLDTLAELCNITKFYLSREFKRYTGQTIFTYVAMLKCKKAQNCLLQGMTVTETALSCGFDNVSYFSQTYKKIMGVSPLSVKKGLS